MANVKNGNKNIYKEYGPQHKQWRDERKFTSIWRTHLDPNDPNCVWNSSVRLNVEQKEQVIKYLAAGATPAKICELFDIDLRTYKSHREKDSMFNERCMLAEERYHARVLEEMQKRAFGWEEPLYYQGKPTGHTRQMFDMRALEMEAKRVEPGYRDKQNVNVNVAPGVIVVGEKPKEALDWEAEALAVLEGEVKQIPPTTDDQG